MSALLSFLAGPLLAALLRLAEARLKNTGARESEAAGLAREAIRAEVAARAEARALLVAEGEHFFSAARLGRLLFVLPLGLWWGAVMADSVFAFSWNVAALPAPLDDWAGAILASLFLVDGMKGVARAWRVPGARENGG
ncbi:MAG: hypothetical protein CMN87_19810 [Stappia sp.]|uniref:hypothetical protein n=1 Tax=Stappia sp. TaxID=1870903 RepID=UPI000C5E8F5B|nr:hypothetical protein [Stappia sp.]MAB01097.1 hypothetical protein [Stappia sp.]MBM22254.1 hypothetical protein [Stappia sp.]